MRSANTSTIQLLYKTKQNELHNMNIYDNIKFSCYNTGNSMTHDSLYGETKNINSSNFANEQTTNFNSNSISKLKYSFSDKNYFDYEYSKNSNRKYWKINKFKNFADVKKSIESARKHNEEINKNMLINRPLKLNINKK